MHRNVFQEPTKGDLDRNLSFLMHRARQQASDERQRISRQMAARGLGQSGNLIRAVIDAANQIHENSMTEAMHIIHQFVSRMQVEVSTVTAWARPHLENLSSVLLAEIPFAGLGERPRDQILQQYRAVFAQRLDGALRDIEVGFIKGSSIALPAAPVFDLKFTLMGLTLDFNGARPWLQHLVKRLRRR